MFDSRQCRVIAVALIAVLVALGCAKPPTGPRPPETSPGERSPYVIGIPDVLNISVWKNPEISGDVLVRSDGMISVPLIGDVQAEGLTPVELTEVIGGEISNFIATPDVTVTVVRSDSLAATVVGAVGHSGVVPLTRQTRVLEAIAAVGGFTTWARKNDVRIIRRSPEGLVTYKFSYGAYLSGDDPGGNMVLKPGDTVVVPD